MGAGDKSSIWHLILHATEHITPGTVRQFCQETEAVKLCSFEAADEEVKRDHFHIALNYGEEEMVRSTLQRQLKKSFPNIKGNTDYTTHLPEKGQTIDGLYDYISKGKKKYLPYELVDGDVPGPAIVYSIPTIQPIVCQQRFHRKQREFQSEAAKLAEKRATEKVTAKHKVISELILVYQEFDVNHHTAQQIFRDVRRMYKGDLEERTLLTIVSAVLWSINSTDADQIVWNRIKDKIF